jgi:hypothetical protein
LSTGRNRSSLLLRGLHCIGLVLSLWMCAGGLQRMIADDLHLAVHGGEAREASMGLKAE